MRSYLRSLNPQLPRDVWLLQGGGLANSLGNGIVFPFLFIYLKDVRGFSPAVAGAVIAVSSFGQVAAGLAAGTVVDRIGARRTLAAALVLQAVGFGLMPLVRAPWHAFALVTLEGAASAAFWPAQSTLMTGLTSPARRHAAFAQQRVTMNLGIGLGGLVGGQIASVGHASSFTVLFAVDAVTFLLYVGVLALVADAPAHRHGDAPRASYRAVLRDRLFVRLWALNFLFVAAGYSLFNLVPPFAHDEAGVRLSSIGIVYLVNTLTIVILQLPISRAIEGKRRMRALALMPALWVVTWLLVEFAGGALDGREAAVMIGVALAIFGIGECFHGPAHQALVAEIGPDYLRGRYFALHSMSWGLGGTAGPAVGGALLGAAPFALWPLAAGICGGTAVAALALERRVPEPLRRIPRAEPVAPVVAEVVVAPTPID